jgi:pimeloyl-ACP methyl ester carboxylesterase
MTSSSSARAPPASPRRCTRPTAGLSTIVCDRHVGAAAAAADDLKGLCLTEVVAHYEGLIRGLPEPPVLVGHSFGGLIVELLLDRGLGRAGAAISPARPGGSFGCRSRR